MTINKLDNTRILIATGIYPPEIGGPATYAFLLVEELSKRGMTVDVLPFREVRHLPRLVRHAAYFIKIAMCARKAGIIFTQDPVSTGFAAICAGKLMKKKTVLRVAGDYAWEQASQRYGVSDTIDEFQNKKYSFPVQVLRWVQSYTVRHADIVITPSEYFNKLVSGWTKRKDSVITIYNGINLEEDFERLPKYESMTIVTAGRLVPWKGFDTLISVMPELPGWRLTIAGEGPDRERLVGLAEKNGVSDRVIFLGQIGRRELFALIHRSTLFALLSTFESFSFQTVEAMHIGVPVIVGRIGNLSEIVDDGINGLLIDPSDKQAFVRLAKKIATDSSYADRLAGEARKKAELFSVTRMVDRLVEIFDLLLKSYTV